MYQEVHLFHEVHVYMDVRQAKKKIIRIQNQTPHLVCMDSPIETAELAYMSKRRDIQH